MVVSATGRVLRKIDNNAKPPNLPRVPLRGGVPRAGTQIQNPEVLATFEAATANAISLYRDANDDGTLTDDELVPVAVATAP